MVDSSTNDAVDVVFAALTESTSLVILVYPTSVRSARVPALIRMFRYVNLSIIVGNGYGNRTPLRSP